MNFGYSAESGGGTYTDTPWCVKLWSMYYMREQILIATDILRCVLVLLLPLLLLLYIRYCNMNFKSAIFYYNRSRRHLDYYERIYKMPYHHYNHNQIRYTAVLFVASGTKHTTTTIQNTITKTASAPARTPFHPQIG